MCGERAIIWRVCESDKCGEWVCEVSECMCGECLCGVCVVSECAIVWQVCECAIMQIL